MVKLADQIAAEQVLRPALQGVQPVRPAGQDRPAPRRDEAAVEIALSPAARALVAEADSDRAVKAPRPVRRAALDYAGVLGRAENAGREITGEEGKRLLALQREINESADSGGARPSALGERLLGEAEALAAEAGGEPLSRADRVRFDFLVAEGGRALGYEFTREDIVASARDFVSESVGRIDRLLNGLRGGYPQAGVRPAETGAVSGYGPTGAARFEVAGAEVVDVAGERRAAQAGYRGYAASVASYARAGAPEPGALYAAFV